MLPLLGLHCDIYNVCRLALAEVVTKMAEDFATPQVALAGQLLPFAIVRVVHRGSDRVRLYGLCCVAHMAI